MTFYPKTIREILMRSIAFADLIISASIDLFFFLFRSVCHSSEEHGSRSLRIYLDLFICLLTTVHCKSLEEFQTETSDVSEVVHISCVITFFSNNMNA